MPPSKSSMAGWRVRTTNGNPIKVSAIATPKGENAALIP
jgi:hypothetical protein